jgi:hypothetical protein
MPAAMTRYVYLKNAAHSNQVNGIGADPLFFGFLILPV